MTAERRRAQLRREDDRRSPGRAERVLMVVSVLFTLTLFGYVTYQAVTIPAEAEPEARVIGTSGMPGGGVLVRIEFVNPGGVGLRLATVQVDCAELPPSVDFTNVPAGGRHVGSLVCPAGTTDPRATVSAFVEA